MSFSWTASTPGGWRSQSGRLRLVRGEERGRSYSSRIWGLWEGARYLCPSEREEEPVLVVTARAQFRVEYRGRGAPSIACPLVLSVWRGIESASGLIVSSALSLTLHALTRALESAERRLPP